MNSGARQANKSFASKSKKHGTSWSQTVLDEKGNIVLITSRTKDGEKAFYYMLLTQTQRDDLARALEEMDEVDLADYGHIARSGWGEPGEEDKAFMREQFFAEA